MGLKYLVLSKHPGSMSPEELLAELGSADDSKLIRSLVMAELAAIRAGEERAIRTMRGLWYSLIKPALSRLGRLNIKTSGGKGKDWDRTLSRELGKIVTLGATTYEEMSIIDGSRLRTKARAFTLPMVRVPITGAHYPHIILCSEKDTIYQVIEQVAGLYGVSCYSGGGQPSKAATENLVLEIVRSPSYKHPQPITILSLTDYDPAGYSISESFFAQVQESLRSLDIEAQHIRLGLEPAQLNEDELSQNIYQPKGKGSKPANEWLARTGGIRGEFLGLELDALPIDRIRLMFAEGIEQEISLAEREQDLRKAAFELIACELLLPAFEAQKKELMSQVIQSGVMAEMDQLPSDLFKRAALQGLSSIDPVKADLFGSEHIRALLSSWLEEAG